MNIEQALERPSIDRSEALIPFMSWLSSYGALMGSVELVDLPLYGYSLRAISPIKVGDLLVTVPQKLLLSVETARASSIGSKDFRVFFGY